MSQSIEPYTARNPTLLATCQAYIITEGHAPYQVRMLLDQGSELSFLTEDTVRKVQLKRRNASIPLLGIGGTYSGRTRGAVSVHLRSRYATNMNCTIQAFILPRLTTKLPSVNFRCPSWTHIQGLQLADPDFSRAGTVDLIIGSDNYGVILRDGLRRGHCNEPIAQRTIFGWIVSGPVSTTEICRSATGQHCSADLELQESLTKFWMQEELPRSVNPALSPDEEECEKHFVTTHSRDSSGRYIVRLPFKSPPSTLGESYSRALHCFWRLIKRFATDELYKTRYEEFLRDYEELGHMRALTAESLPIPINYLPHHGILREHSSTTKLRVVFNGSSPTTNGISLNDILHAGAKLQTDLSDVLLWIRSHRFIFSTDIAKMFRQIAVHSDDWRHQTILWTGSNQEPTSYHLTTVTYGLKCAPFLALRTINQLIIDEGPRFPKAVMALTNGRYVDDIFGGADTASDARECACHVAQLCMAGGFPLQKWKSNSPETILQDLNIDSNPTSPVEFDSSLTKLLGLIWRPDTDTFHFFDQPSATGIITKRTILSEIARLFDPLGFISPVLIRAKLLLQELWLLRIGWDDPVPENTQRRWIDFQLQLTTLKHIAIPRWLNLSPSQLSVELHGFSDASNLALAAAVYVRVQTGQENYSTRLVCAKTRVAPIKRVTIPRLELTAALLLSRLMSHVRRTLELHESPIYLWTDSSVALTWITAHPSRWKDFVRNRVSIIQELLPSGSFRYVPGKQNPSDCATRGLRPEQLTHHALWWDGPEWLAGPSALWPTMTDFPAMTTDMEERSLPVLVVASTPLYWELIDRYSSLSRLLRITAICRRFIRLLKRVPESTVEWPLRPEELRQSENFWAKHVQRSCFPEELKILASGASLPRSHPLVRLIPFIDRDGILRVGGRLHFARLEPSSKHPIILPRRSPFTTLIIADAHRRTLHGGTQLTLGFIRHSWIVGGRAPVRSFILKCTRCVRFRGVRAKQLMGQLPSPRVTPARPFLHAGLDYAGPIMMKTWRGRAARKYKGYLAIFVCLATSAIHIELVTDYTTEAFIAAYKRFTGRRGICATLCSDCGTNFVGADAALRQRFSTYSKELQELATLLANDGTTWNFNPPAAPHFGGKWEAAVKSTKFHLMRVVGNTTLTYEELSTVMTQIEAVLNSRSLCPLSEDPEDYAALTPGHFLIGEAPTTLPEPNLSAESISRLTRWQLLKQLVDHFWERWSRECLQRYQAVAKWYHPSNVIKEGSLVLITDERYPPSKWPLARVKTLHPGPDGLTRVVTLRTATSVFQRPIVKLCVLPVNDEESDSPTQLSKAGGECRVRDTTSSKNCIARARGHAAGSHYGRVWKSRGLEARRAAGRRVGKTSRTSLQDCLAQKGSCAWRQIKIRPR